MYILEWTYLGMNYYNLICLTLFSIIVSQTQTTVNYLTEKSNYFSHDSGIEPGTKLDQRRVWTEHTSMCIYTFQHYPLYRESDSVCTEPDAAPLPERNSLFEERWDCLSKESTEYLVESLRPRAAFGAHTHHSCVVRHSFVPTPDHKIEFIEYTVPSFSWRNRLDPKYYLVRNQDNFHISLQTLQAAGWQFSTVTVLLQRGRAEKKRFWLVRSDNIRSRQARPW